jgi:hypothetical protein
MKDGADYIQTDDPMGYQVKYWMILEASHTPRSNAEFKNTCSFTSTSPYPSHGAVLRYKNYLSIYFLLMTLTLYYMYTFQLRYFGR